MNRSPPSLLAALTLLALALPTIAQMAAPPLDAVKTPADWPAERAKILEGMQQAMGPLPDRSPLPPLDVKITNRSKADGIETLTISLFAETIGDHEDRIPALLLIPESAGEGSGADAQTVADPGIGAHRRG